MRNRWFAVFECVCVCVFKLAYNKQLPSKNAFYYDSNCPCKTSKQMSFAGERTPKNLYLRGDPRVFSHRHLYLPRRIYNSIRCCRSVLFVRSVASPVPPLSHYRTCSCFSTFFSLSLWTYEEAQVNTQKSNVRSLERSNHGFEANEPRLDANEKWVRSSIWGGKNAALKRTANTADDSRNKRRTIYEDRVDDDKPRMERRRDKQGNY